MAHAPRCGHAAWRRRCLRSTSSCARQGRRRRRVQLHGRAARRGSRDLGARGPDTLRVGAELVLAPRAGDAETVFPVCHEHGLGYEAFGPLAGGWLAGPLPARRGLPAGLAHDAAARRVPQVRERRDVRRARGVRARGARARRVDGRLSRSRGCSACPRSRPSWSGRPEPSSSSRCARRWRSSSRQRSTRIWEACSRDRPLRARRARAPRHDVVRRGDDRGARLARARRALQPAAVDRPASRRRHAARAHAGVPRGAVVGVRAQGDRDRARRTRRAASTRTWAASSSTTARPASCSRS